MTQVVRSETTPAYVTGTAVVPAQADVPMSIEAAVDRYNLVVRFVKAILREGTDYGKVPGVDKPFLLKPGAEKLAGFFGFQTVTACTDKAVDWDKPFFAFTYRTEVKRGGEVVATCDGSCNSMESKYRWRNVPEWKATDADKQQAIRVETKHKRDGGGAFKVYVIANDDLYSIHNTIMKMAEKRSFVGAIQIACGASEFFASEMEEIAEAVWHEVEPENGHTEDGKAGLEFIDPTGHDNWVQRLMTTVAPLGYNHINHVLNALKVERWDTSAMDYAHAKDIIALLKARHEKAAAAVDAELQEVPA